MDPDTATVKYLREALATHFGADLGERKQFIKDTVDAILSEAALDDAQEADAGACIGDWQLLTGAAADTEVAGALADQGEGRTRGGGKWPEKKTKKAVAKAAGTGRKSAWSNALALKPNLAALLGEARLSRAEVRQWLWCRHTSAAGHKAGVGVHQGEAAAQGSGASPCMHGACVMAAERRRADPAGRGAAEGTGAQDD